MWQIYRRTPMPKCDFNKVPKQLEITLRRACCRVNLLHILKTTFNYKNTSGGLVLLSTSKNRKKYNAGKLSINIDKTKYTFVHKVKIRDKIPLK